MRYNILMIVVRRLVWEKTNADHIARHGVSQSEVEEVCHNKPVFLSGHSGRVMAVGLTSAGKAISVILDAEEEHGVWYPVTARSADRNERLYYQQKKGVKL